jgi:hypothetical protein
MRQRHTANPADAPALGQMHFQKCAMASAEFAERMQRLDRARALRPAAARARRQRDHGHFTRRQRGHARFQIFLRQLARGVEHVAFGHVLNLRADWQTVLRQADAARFQIRADLLVLRAVEAVAFEQCRQRFVAGVVGLQARQQPVEKRLHHAAQFGLGPAGGGEFVHFRAVQRRQGAGILPQQRRHDERVISRGNSADLPCSRSAQVPRSLMAKSYTTGSIANGREFSSSCLVCVMIPATAPGPPLSFAGSKINPMPPPDMPPSIQKPQKSFAELRRTRLMMVSVNKFVAHGMMVWMGPRNSAWSPRPGPRRPALKRRRGFRPEWRAC